MTCSRRSRFCTLVALTLVVSFFAVVAPVQALKAQEQLQWKLQKGDQFSMKMKQVVKQKTKAFGQVQEVPITSTMEMTWKVTDSTSEEFSVEQTIDRFQLEMQAAGQDLTYDSASDDVNPLLGPVAAAIKPIVGKAFIQRNARSGEVLETVLPKELEESGGGAGNLLSGEALKQMTSQAALVFPKEGLTRGKEWETTAEVANNGITMKLVTKYRYDGTEEVDARPLHKFHTTVETSILKPLPGMEIAIKNQDTQGDLYFDAEAGRMVSVKTEQVLEMEIRGQGQVIVQTMNQNVMITVEPKKSP